MTFETLRYEVEGGIAVVTVNRPEARNSISDVVIREMYAALDAVRADAGVGALIITGAGDEAFVSGADIRAIAARRRREALAGLNNRLFAAIEALEKPTLAAVNGYALGGGLELALACDIRVAASGARFGLPEVKLGIIPAAGGTQRLPRIIGLGRARYLILTGDIIDASEAERLGLVSAVVPRGELLAKAREIAGKILKRGPLAIRLAKKALSLSAEVPLSAGLEFESVAQAILFESRDKEEGTRAFLEKREPRFTGE
ncbi:MAG: enoyl-CoA hydratase/isomerase family protein [bacterium]